MKFPRFAFWPIIILLIIVAIAVPLLLADTIPETTGYRGYPAALDTYDIYAQLTDDPRLTPAVDQVQQLVKDKGQVASFGVSRIRRGKNGKPTTVTVYVNRNNIRYKELVMFDDDGTFLEIISTPIKEKYPD